MVERKYTFRATRKTKWIADIIDSIPDQDKAEFIRECFIEGLKLRDEYQEFVAHPERFQRKETASTKFSATRQPPKKPVLQVIDISEEDTDEKVDRLSSLYD